MAIALKKGAQLNLTKKHPGLQQVFLGLGWDVRLDAGSDFDLDASVFLLNQQGLVSAEPNFVYYGNLRSACGAVVHGGDNTSGIGDGDDELILINLNRVPAQVMRMVVVVTINEALERQQTFGQVNSAFIRLVDQVSAKELLRYDLTGNYQNCTSLVFAELHRFGNAWKFKALGQGGHFDLRTFAHFYGLETHTSY